MSAPTVSAGQSFARFVLVICVGLTLALLFIVVAAKHTHPRPTHPGNQRPATTHPHRPVTETTK